MLEPNGQVLLGGRAASAALARRDPRFAPLKARFGPALHPRGRNPFAAIVESIAHQQLSLAAGRTVYGRVEAMCAGAVRPARLLAAGPEQLRACGLSRPKVGYVLDLAAKAQAGDLPLDRLHAMPDEAVLEALTSVKGIGVWTAQMLLIFTLHRPDVLPTADLGIVDAARLVLGERRRPLARRLERIAQPWRPYRSVACWYLWRERDRLVRPATAGAPAGRASKTT